MDFLPQFGPSGQLRGALVAACVACAGFRKALIYNHMVVASSVTHNELDQLFRALADRTRRDIVARALSGEEASVSTLASRYHMSFAAVQKHVAVLERAKLVSKLVAGRERIVRGSPQRLARARAALVELESIWLDRFSQVDNVLLTHPSAKGK